MSTLVSKVLAAGAAVSMLTLPGLSPAAAAPGLGEGQPSSAASSPADESQQNPTGPAADGGKAANDEARSAAEPTSTDDTASAQEAEAGTQVQLLNITDFHGRISDAGTQVASVVEEQRAAVRLQGRHRHALGR